MPTLAEVIVSARDLSFDRFVTPTFYIKGVSGDKLTINATELIVKDSGDAIQSTFSFATYPTLRELAAAIIADPRSYSISYTSSFIASEASTSLMALTDKVITEAQPVHRTYFFSEAKIHALIIRYYETILCTPCGEVEESDLATEVSELGCHRPEHLALWIAYWLVEERRLYELAAETIGQSTFNGSGDAAFVGTGEDGSAITVSIGDVFTITDSEGLENNEGELAWNYGADNVLGDATSFWYRLQLWIRRQVEQLFGDNSLRPDTVMMGEIDLVKDRNFYAYFDNYPYTISPLSREIVSSFWSN